MHNIYPIKTGFEKLDKIIKGFYPGELAVIGARPTTGKTSFMYSLMMQITWGKGIPSLIFSPDMPKKVLYNKCRQAIHSTNDAAMIFLSYMFLSQIEIDNITNIIEGIRYSVSKNEIEDLLVLKQA